MVQKKAINGTTARKLVSILFLFMLFSFCLLRTIAQDGGLQDIVSDSTEIVIEQSQQLQDSLSKAYVFLSSDRPNLKLDSLRDQITVEGNDFIQWMQRMDVLKGKGERVVGDAIYKIMRPSWVVVALLLLVTGIGLVRLFFKPMFHNVVHAYYNEQVTQDISKEDNLITSWPYIFLYLLFSFSLGLFLLIYISAFGDSDMLTVENYFSLSIFVAVLFVVKILLIRLLGFVFELQRTVREYVAVLYLMYFNSMLILLPFLLIVTFVPVTYFKFLLSLFAIVVSILFIYKFSVTAVRLLGQLKFSIFYLILYLCALEIAPILILVKALNS